MAAKSKFQISKSLDFKIKKLITCPEECDLIQLAHTFILGFNYSNVTNYVALTTNYELHNSANTVTGLAFLKSLPSNQDVKALLLPTREYFSSPTRGIGDNTKTDKNQNLYLVYYRDQETKEVAKKIYDFELEDFLQDQPKLSILDDTKIYAHSTLIKLNTSIKLELFDNQTSLVSVDKLSACFDDAINHLSGDVKNLTLDLVNSNFSTKTPLQNKSTLESLYSHLEVKQDLGQDYLPQMTKEDKAKLVNKERNRLKDQRAPLELNLVLGELSSASGNECTSIYNWNLEEFLYLHVNDPICKSTRLILFLLRVKLNLLKNALVSGTVGKLTPYDIKSCCFKSDHVNLLIQAVYLISSDPDYESLKKSRQAIHESYVIPTNQPVVRYSQRVRNVQFTSPDEAAGYRCNIHSAILEKSTTKGGVRSVVGGVYTYHHYLQGGIRDSGWGCAYRSLQTIISWYKHQGYICSPDVQLRVPATNGSKGIQSLREKLNEENRVPTHQEIQEVLVDVGDKQPSFIGSQNWIGSQEVSWVLSHLYNIESKFISVSSGSELVEKARDLGQHFATQSTPIMIGGGVLAHTIIGTDFNEKNGDISYLILDPHYEGEKSKIAPCSWNKNSFWQKNSFYNLCLPQRPNEF